MSDVLTNVLAVLTSIGEWIAGAVGTLEPIFWDTTNNTLTFVGTLAVVGVGIAVILLIMNIIRNFLSFR